MIVSGLVIDYLFLVVVCCLLCVGCCLVRLRLERCLVRVSC